MENGGAVIPQNHVYIGDASNAPNGISITGNIFASGVGTVNTIHDFNGQSVFIDGNIEIGAPTNFLNHGTLARGLYLGSNRAAGVTNYFAGSDNGADSIVVGGVATVVNQQGPTVTGYGHTQLTGYGQDLIIQTRTGGTNNQTLRATDGTALGSLTNLGVYSVKNKIYPGTDAAAIQTACGMYAGNGAPSNANGSNGDYYLRGDGTQAGNTCIYHKEAGSWVALVTT